MAEINESLWLRAVRANEASKSLGDLKGKLAQERETVGWFASGSPFQEHWASWQREYRQKVVAALEYLENAITRYGRW